MSGGSINTLGGSIDTSEIDAATLVVESETITSNDNDTTIPTSAAVKNYADAETGTLTNKTFDTAGAGNSFSINSTAISAVTGTGSAVLATSPTLTTPDIGTPSAAVLTNATGTAASLTAGNVTTNANLTGIVTSTGNATAIAAKAIAISKLADGTDGELITWSATGVIEAVAVGTATHVLTSNGAGLAPTFQLAPAGGDVSKVGTPVNSQVGVWTGDGTIEGATSLTYDGANFQLTGDIGATGSRITKGWLTDLTVTNAIAGSVTGNAVTVTTNANLTGDVTSIGNATTTVTNANLTGDVTSVGNATTIAAKAVDVAMLADGTDGELITWGTDAVATTVPAGSNNDVLTSNGAGAAPTFQASGGGGLAGTSVKTIGTSGDYSDVTAAIASESTPYHFVLVSDVTEDSDVALDGVTVLDLDRYTLTMGNFDFSYAAEADIYIKGAGPESGAEIDYTHTGSANQLFENASFIASIVDIENIKIDNNSSNSSTKLSNAVENLRHILFELPNQGASGINANQDGSSFDNCHFVGGGTSSSMTTSAADKYITFNNIVMSGTWIDGTSLQVNDGFVVNNIVFDHATNATELTSRGGLISNVSVVGGQALNISCSNAEVTYLNNVNTGGGTIDVTNTSEVVAVNVTSNFDLSGAGSGDCQLSNCRIATAMTIADQNNKFSNCVFEGGATLSSAGDDCGFTNCQFGVDGGGGALTLTIDSGATGTRIAGCMSDAAIVDNGTGTVTAANVVY